MTDHLTPANTPVVIAPHLLMSNDIITVGIGESVVAAKVSKTQIGRGETRVYATIVHCTGDKIISGDQVFSFDFDSRVVWLKPNA